MYKRQPLRHCANTGAVALYPETYMDMVRPGLLLYGYGEFAEKLGLRPAMALKAMINTIKIYDEGTDISYGRLFTTSEPTRIGVIPYGYADGFFRCLSNRCSIMTADGPAPQRGRICMDMSMIDLSELPNVGVGDEVEIFGENMRGFAQSGPEETRHINKWLADNCFGDYYTRGGLDTREREMVTLCFLAAQGGCEPQLTAHAKANMVVGNEKAFLIAVVSQCMPYIGYPRTLNAIRCIDEAVKG